MYELTDSYTVIHDHFHWMLRHLVRKEVETSESSCNQCLEDLSKSILCMLLIVSCKTERNGFQNRHMDSLLKTETSVTLVL